MVKLLAGAPLFPSTCSPRAAPSGSAVLAQAELGTASLRTRPSSELAQTTGFKVALVVLVLGEAIGVAFGGGAWAAHRRIRAALTSADPCDFDRATGDLSDYGNDEERAEQDRRKGACVEKNIKTGCDAVMAHLDANRVTDQDLAFIGSNSPSTPMDGVVHRMGVGNLVTADLGTTKADLPCGDGIWNRLVSAAASAPNMWALGSNGVRPGLSNEMRASLAATTLSADVQRAIQASEEAVVQPVLKKTRTEDMADAESFCELGTALRVSPPTSCVTLAKRYLQAKTREDAVAAAKQSSATAQDARCMALDVARENCIVPCMSFDLFDPRADSCEAACERRFPKTGCE